MTTWEYIRDLYRPNDRIVIAWKLPAAQTFHQRFLTADAACRNAFQRFLRAMNAQGNNIYIGMNPILPGSRHRTKQDIADIRRIYLDLDHDGERGLAAILESRELPKPNYILNTSAGKFQVIWNVWNFTPQMAENLMRNLARNYHADPGTIDAARVFRLPGLHNKKYDLTFQVTARKLSSTLYPPHAFAACEPLSTLTRPVPRRASSQPRHSQSERDWAYCCSALWPNPFDEAVYQRLLNEMEARAQGRRAKPRYYAKLTVEKARTYIACKRNFSPPK